MLHMQKNPWTLVSYWTLVALHFFPIKTPMALDSGVSDMAVCTGASVLQPSRGNMKLYLILLAMNSKR